MAPPRHASPKPSINAALRLEGSGHVQFFEETLESAWELNTTTLGVFYTAFGWCGTRAEHLSSSKVIVSCQAYNAEEKTCFEPEKKPARSDSKPRLACTFFAVRVVQRSIRARYPHHSVSQRCGALVPSVPPHLQKRLASTTCIEAKEVIWEV